MGENVGLVLKLLEETTTLPIVSAFLKVKGVHYSASGWEDLIANRITPALSNKKITFQELVDLLRDAEEHGKQHIFLYKCPSELAKKLLTSHELSARLNACGLIELQDNPRILDQPEQPTIVDVRIETDPTSGKCLIIKVVEQRLFTKVLDEQVNGNIVTKRYERFFERAVNVIKLHEDGLLEMRIASHTNSSDYRLDVVRFWNQIKSILIVDDFYPLSLQKVKEKVWNERDKLKNEIRFSRFVVRNEEGIALEIACGPDDQTLADSEGAVSSIDNFIEHDGYFDKSNIWFLANGVEVPSRDMHILLTKERNEFAVTANCNKDDYCHVINRLKTLNS